MNLGGIDWWGVVIATVATFVCGFVWFNQKTFFDVWWRLMGKTGEEPGGGHNMAMIFGSLVLGLVIQNLVVAVVINSVKGDVSLGGAQGALWGLAVGLAIAAASLGHRLFAGHGYRVWLIEAGNDVVNCVIAGAILGVMS